MREGGSKSRRGLIRGRRKEGLVRGQQGGSERERGLRRGR